MCWHPNETETQMDKYVQFFKKSPAGSLLFHLCPVGGTRLDGSLQPNPFISVRGTSSAPNLLFFFGGRGGFECSRLPNCTVKASPLDRSLSISFPREAKRSLNRKNSRRFYRLFCIFSPRFLFLGVEVPGCGLVSAGICQTWEQTLLGHYSCC